MGGGCVGSGGVGGGGGGRVVEEARRGAVERSWGLVYYLKNIKLIRGIIFSQVMQWF